MSGIRYKHLRGYFVKNAITRYIVIETFLGGKNIVQGPLLLKLLFVGLKTMSPSNH